MTNLKNVVIFNPVGPSMHAYLNGLVAHFYEDRVRLSN